VAAGVHVTVHGRRGRGISHAARRAFPAVTMVLSLIIIALLLLANSAIDTTFYGLMHGLA